MDGAPVLPPVGTIVGEQYTIVRLIGHGGMGGVFEVVRGSDRFALKLITLGTVDAAVIARFVREARVASTVASANLVPVLDSGVDKALAQPFLVMPLIDGFDLGSAIERVGPLAPEIAARIVVQAGRGIAALHSAGIVHRDVKPSNIMLSRERGVLHVRLCDFGIAKDQSSAALTSTGTVLGSPLYMAPEQFTSSKAVDARADVWSLGMTLFEALAGQAAFAHLTSVSEIIIASATGEMRDVQDLAPWVDGKLAVVLHGALVAKLEARCPSVAALCEALRPFTGGVEDVTEDDLAPLSPERRAVAAARVRRPQSWAIEIGPTVPPPRSSEDERAGEVVGGSFRLVRKIGQGGMGAVYEAETKNGGRAAVKLISGGEGREALRRFAREGRAVMSIQSDNVVRVLAADAEPASGPPYLAMELLHGVDLDTLVRRMGGLEPAAVARVFVQACRGLGAAHKNGIVHRDIKPANLFLHELSDGTIVTKVCDFGVAKHGIVSADGAEGTLDLTRTGGMLGSPLYMSPEQAKNAKHVDARTDIWSLSISLYEALSGQKPWEGLTTMGELILAICTGDIKPLQDLAPWVDPALASIVHRGLERDPTRRWASVADLEAALTPLASPEPMRRSALRGITPELRATPAPRLSRSTHEVSRTAGPISRELDDASLRRAPSHSRAPLVIGVALLGAAAAAAFAFTSRSKTTSVAGEAPSVAASEPQRRHVEVYVRPASARVTVRGNPVRLDAGGVLPLEGAIGESFDVVVETDDGRTSASVVIPREGAPQPSLLEVATTAPKVTPVASASASSIAIAPRPAQKQSTRAESGPKHSAEPAAPQPAATPAAPPPTPKFKDTL